MKAKVTFLLLFALGLNLAVGQQDPECMANLSLFHESVKIKEYDKAYEPWMATRNKCPKLNNAIYIDGEKILKHKIKNSSGAEKTAHVNDLLKLYDESLTHMGKKFKKGTTLAKKAQVKYENKLGTNYDVYQEFDNAYKTDAASFRNPRRLYFYFETLYKSYKGNEGGATIEQLFDKYEDLKEKFAGETKKLSLSLDRILKKEEAGQPLTKKDQKTKKRAETNGKAFSLFETNMDKLIETEAKCEVLIPMYTKNFDANKSNGTWLKRAAGRMVAKECTADPLFVQIVEAYHALEPSAESAYYLGVLSLDKKDYANAKKYFDESAQLHTDAYKKASVYMKIAQMEKRRGAKSSARSFANKAIAQRPSYGSAYLLIASLYASSANDCGSDVFEKKAVYWAAAKMANRAGQVDPSAKSRAAKSAASYNAKAPSKTDIFNKGAAGKTIQIGCWINTSVKVPNI
ncbi:MAG: hypothetical protein HRT68_00730 [Flavobacteriaceae bacterium]|nr:hypothetical protein [Flavobacteriaceae bacterium]